MSGIKQPWLVVFPFHVSLGLLRPGQDFPLSSGRDFPFKYLLKSKEKKIPFLQLPLSSGFSWLHVFCDRSTCETQVFVPEIPADPLLHPHPTYPRPLHFVPRAEFDSIN